MDTLWSSPVPLLNLEEARWKKNTDEGEHDKPSTSKNEHSSPQDAPVLPPIQGQDKVNDWLSAVESPRSLVPSAPGAEELAAPLCPVDDGAPSS